MISDTYPSTLATGVPYGAGIVSWGDFATGVAVYEEDPIRPPAANVGFALWKDMVEEPWKFGDDIGDWLALDAELRAAPGRWRIEAYWMQVEQRQNWERLEAMLWKAWNEYLTRKDRMATRIQALVRGHLARNRTPWRDCCMCLAHHVSPIKTDVGFMCRQCSRDGPFCDLIGMDDPWEWHRAEK
jgi:hypothetical protein